MDIKNLIASHRKSVGLSFLDIGFKRPVNVDTITLATALYGDSFLTALLNRIEQEPEPYSNLEGDKPTPTFGNIQTLPMVTVTSKKTKAQKKEAAINTITQLANVFAGAYGSYQKGKGVIAANATPQPTDEDRSEERRVGKEC